MSSFEKHYAGLDITSSDNNGKLRPVSRVTLYVDDENVVTAGDDTGLEISADCPNATQAIANALLARFKGFQYQTMSANDTGIDPAAELGDGITADGIYSVIAQIRDDGSGYVSVTAPGEQEQEDEYPMDGPLIRTITRATDRKIADTRSSIAKTAEQIRAEVQGVAGNVSSLSVTVGGITQQVRDIDGRVTTVETTADGLTTSVKGLDGRVSTIDQRVDNIKLSVSGSLGGSASITLSGGGGGSGTIDLSKVRQSFANDKTAIAISAGTVTFNSNTFVVNSTNFSVTENGTITAKAGTIGNWDIGSTTISQSLTTGGHTYNVTLANYANDNAGSRVFHCSIDGTDTFYVHRDGKLYATNAEITGKITATSGTFKGAITTSEGHIGGWVIEAGGISYDSSDGLNQVKLRHVNNTSKGNSVFHIATRAKNTGDDKWDAYPFRVNGDGSFVATMATIKGTVTATSGKIGNWTIGDALYSGTNSMNSTTAGTYLGTDGIRNYASGSKFVNITGGVLTAKGANIEGAITATSGSFKGAVTATGGKIGGWDINSNGIVYETDNGLHRVTLRYPEQATPSTGVFYISSRTSASGDWSYPFRVNGDGTCSATNFKISGDSSFSGKLSSATGSVSGITGSTSGITLGGTSTNSGTISGGTYSQPTISSSTLSGTTTNTGATITGGTVSSATVSRSTISGGTLSGSTGGTYVGTCSGSTLSSCTTGGTSLTVGDRGSFTTTNLGNVTVRGTSSAVLEAGNAWISIGGSSCIIWANTEINSDLTCLGEKKRVIKTKNYGYRGLHAFETPLPTFSDYGTAALDETGVFRIIIDPVFAETVNDTYLPTVFLTKYGEGDIWVELVEHDIVTVRGTPGLSFAWETRYAQANAEIARMQVMDFDYQDMRTANDFQGDAAIAYEHSTGNIDYARLGYEYYTDFERSLSS